MAALRRAKPLTVADIVGQEGAQRAVPSSSEGGPEMTRVVIGLICLYQRCVSAWLPPVCRFHPTCSEYAAQAIRLHGLWVGVCLAGRRLLSCHPFHPGGYDPVPPPTAKNAAETLSGDDAQRGIPKGQMSR